MAKATRSFQAQEDFDDLAAYIARTNPTAAWQFLTAVERTIQLLAASPGMGSAFPIRDFPQLRCHSILPKFRNYFVFYEPTDEGVFLVRVLHGYRDIPTVLDGE